MKLPSIGCVAAALASAACAYCAPEVSNLKTSQPSAIEIVQRSVAANTADWKAQPQYSHTERDITWKYRSDGTSVIQETRTYEIMMIQGSPYNRLIQVHDKPLTVAQEQQERTKLNREIQRRESESAGARRERLTKFERERADDRFLMEQMIKAFKFTLAGERQTNGVDCYVLNAEPDPDYQPPSEKARVLTGMRGRLYVEKTHYHWVKVEAEVISPVQMMLFAKVKPGTKFELDQGPVGEVWLPKRFSQSVNASVMGLYGMRSGQEEVYSDYHQTMLDAGVRPQSSAAVHQ